MVFICINLTNKKKGEEAKPLSSNLNFSMIPNLLCYLVELFLYSFSLIFLVDFYTHLCGVFFNVYESDRVSGFSMFCFEAW